MQNSYEFPGQTAAIERKRGKTSFHHQVGTIQNRFLEAYAATYDNYARQIFRYIRYRVADEKVAEDLTAQVFMKGWEKIGDYEPGGAQFLTWLYTIAHNGIVDHYRTYKETVNLETSGGLASDRLSPEEEIENHIEREILINAIRRLTTDQQNVVILRFYDGLSTAEIAAKMGKREGTIRALQMRALQSLSRLLVQRA